MYHRGQCPWMMWDANRNGTALLIPDSLDGVGL
jgi:hypothetical protein